MKALSELDFEADIDIRAPRVDRQQARLVILILVRTFQILPSSSGVVEIAGVSAQLISVVVSVGSTTPPIASVTLGVLGCGLCLLKGFASFFRELFP
jgi:hypothetical protein